MTFPPIPESDLADRLRETMKRNGHSLLDVHAITGVATSTINEYRTGHKRFFRRPPAFRTLLYYTNVSAKTEAKPLDPCSWIPKLSSSH